MHLFSSIQFDNRLTSTRLADILSSSPHIIAYIRDLEVNPCNGETLAPIARVAWSHISAISLVKHGDAEEPAFELLMPLISLPTLRKLSIRGDAWDTHRLRAVLANNLLPRYPPPRITHLEIWFAGSIWNVLVDAACPLDFSHLLHVECRFSTASGLFRFLNEFGRTIQSLDIQATDLERLDMQYFPALSHVTVRGRGDALERAIERCCESSIQAICYPLAAWMSPTNLDAIQSVILSRNPPALRRVEVNVTTAKETPAGWRSLLETRLSQLAQRGILAITFR
ncbi:hypothetical protein B0H14DRAFT_3863433 [Mycena olivaceomarginata]|nr:hypothetical protein B0H14DRAFT_3863433 [Mycena olivaceomarginata]